jgi:hypothetical protein
MNQPEVGEKDRTAVESPLLAHDWYKNLSDKQLLAYIRYQYIYLKDNAIDWDAPQQIRHRPMYDGGKDNYGVRRTSVWGEIRKHTQMYDAIPGMWVHAHFSPAAELKLNPMTSGLPDIRPSFLHSGRSPVIYQRYAAMLPETLAYQYDIAGRTISDRFLTTASLGMAQADQRLYVLCDESYVSASPFFRHAFAAAGACDDAIEMYLWPAAIDYEVNQTAYDTLIVENNEDWWITDNLKAAVIEIRQHWENYNG